jgi:putative Holliday junction resolvase
MKFLGIDYGKRKVGLALSDGVIAEPFRVIRYKKEGELVKRIEEVLNTEKVEFIVVGVSEGKMAEETKNFVRLLKETVRTPIIFQDESLSTYTAKELALKANIKRRKRQKMEDAYSAAIILQNYLDNLS